MPVMIMNLRMFNLFGPINKFLYCLYKYKRRAISLPTAMAEALALGLAFAFVSALANC